MYRLFCLYTDDIDVIYLYHHAELHRTSPFYLEITITEVVQTIINMIVLSNSTHKQSLMLQTTL